MKLKWSLHAQSDRSRIYDYLGAESPRAAILVDERIANAIAVLKKFPEIGCPGRIAGTRELVIHRTPYLAAYLVAADTVRILRLLHGAQIWPESMPNR